MQTARLTSFTSQKFRFWAFVSMVLLVFVHGYNLNIRYLQPYTITEEPLTITGFIEYFTANGIFRFRIPMLFAISGFLLALSQKTYGKMVAGRFRTLFLPYLFWSAVMLLLFYVIESFPAGRTMVQNNGIMRISETTFTLHDYKWHEVIRRWIEFPVAYQLWFIRQLFIYNLLFPVIVYLVSNKIARWIYLPLAAIYWIAPPFWGIPLIESEGLLYFSLGIWICRSGFNIEQPPKWLNIRLMGTLFIGLSLFRTWLAFKGFALMGEPTFYLLYFLQKIAIFAGLVTAWYGMDRAVAWAMKQQWFVWASAFSFIIYATHAPLVALAIDALLPLGAGLPYYRLLLYIVLPLSLITMAIAIGLVLRTATPGFYAFITGNRGTANEAARFQKKLEHQGTVMEEYLASTSLQETAKASRTGHSST